MPKAYLKIVFAIISIVLCTILYAEDISSEKEIDFSKETVLSEEALLSDEAMPPHPYQFEEDGVIWTHVAEEDLVPREEKYRCEYKPLAISGADNPAVEKYRRKYMTGRAKDWLVQVLVSGNMYRPYIQMQLKARGMPECLEYLPIVESSFKPTAKSRSGALGLWQFMENSMHPYLKKTDFVDERLDPWKSTDAAVAKLQENYRQFGDWAIALAAYNCGAGAMSRLLKAHPDMDFWELAEKKLLKSESAEYVPKLLAFSDLIQNAEYYGIEIPENPDFEDEPYIYIKIPGAISLLQLSLASEIELTDLTRFNTALTRGITPPGYNLRVPAGSEELIENALERIKNHEFSNAHVVAKGDTLWGISRAYGISVADLCEANGIKENSILSIGKTIYVPILK